MSRAFVNEDNAAAQIDPPVERQISVQTNYVTQRGLDQLHDQVEQLQAQYSEQNARGDEGDKQRMAEIERDLRYFNQRLQSAQVVSSTSDDKVQIGSWVTFADEENVEQRMQLVGEDQADAGSQLINWASPLGKALLGAKVGDEVTWQRPVGDAVIEVVRIEAGD
ncbi:GreA/GreB family elongation factor [Pseudomonas graminis]|uniref:Transcription elongation factor GreB n=1 Tax=Pseudomonas graminis TaxID=158627 RepID=A0A6M8MHQ0_9PSED|nr:GreA/GreB family elongation factor [Pseudomonas graminis]QKF51346.1 Transcription elongation factor GreB [Pseudomonas graminis]